MPKPPYDYAPARPMTSAEQRDRRNRRVAEAGDTLRDKMERQDAAGYRDWSALVEAVLARLQREGAVLSL
jgi:hypothetical protein